MVSSIERHFASLPDPREASGQRHSLTDILTLAICGVICSADSWVEIEQFGHAKENWFRTFLELPYGIPSHDTFGRVFAALDPDAFERCFASWMAGLAEHSQGRLVAIDGKIMRRSFAHAWNREALDMVSAFTAANRMVFGQLAVESKSNEITAIPRLLELLDLRGATVTIDAIGCQKAIAAQIIERRGDYVLAVKENQPQLHQQVQALLDEAWLEDFAGMAHDRCEDTDAGHGRIETRRVVCTPEVQWLRCRDEWPGLRSVAVVESTRIVGAATSTERRYFISSLDGTNAATLARAIRGHWAIENQLHWSLDVSFREDDSRVRTGHAAENFSRLRRIALNLLRRDKRCKIGIKGKRLRAGWDHNYLLQLLSDT